MRRNRNLALPEMCVICVIVILWCRGLPGSLSDVQYSKTAIGNKYLKQTVYTQIIRDHTNRTSGTNYSLVPLLKPKQKLIQAEHLQNSSELNQETVPLRNIKRRLQLLPIKCFTCSDELFPSRYDKLFQSLAEYATFHSKVSNAPQLIWKCGPEEVVCGGLADRLRGIAYTLLLAVFSRRRLLLYWGMPNGEHIYLKPNLINWVTDEYNTQNVPVITSSPVECTSPIDLQLSYESIEIKLTDLLWNSFVQNFDSGYPCMFIPLLLSMLQVLTAL